MLQNAYFLAKIGADTAENEQHFAEILPTLSDVAAAASVADRGRGRLLPGGPRDVGVQHAERPARGEPAHGAHRRSMDSMLVVCDQKYSV